MGSTAADWDALAERVWQMDTRNRGNIYYTTPNDPLDYSTFYHPNYPSNFAGEWERSEKERITEIELKKRFKDKLSPNTKENISEEEINELL